MSTREACDELCEKVHAEPVQCIGKRFVIYRPARKPVIDLDEIVSDLGSVSQAEQSIRTCEFSFLRHTLGSDK